MGSQDTNYGQRLEYLLRDLYSDVASVVTFPHLAFTVDSWPVERVTEITASKPGFWPLHAAGETNTSNPMGPGIERWATPENQSQLFQECRTGAIFYGNDFVIVDALIGSATVRRLLPPEVVSPTQFGTLWQTAADAEARFWKAIRDSIDELRWECVRCTEEYRHLLFLCSPGRVQWVEQLRLFSDQEAIDYLQLEVHEGVLHGRGVFLGRPFDEQFSLE